MRNKSAVAIDIPRRRVYIRGDLQDGYSWIQEWRKLSYANMVMPNPVAAIGFDLFVFHPEWDVQHDPRPL